MHASGVKKVEKTTLYFKREFEEEGLIGGKAFLEEAGTPIRRDGKTETKHLGWMYEPEARKLAKRSGWKFQKI